MNGVWSSFATGLTTFSASLGSLLQQRFTRTRSLVHLITDRFPFRMFRMFSVLDHWTNRIAWVVSYNHSTSCIAIIAHRTLVALRTVIDWSVLITSQCATSFISIIAAGLGV